MPHVSQRSMVAAMRVLNAHGDYGRSGSVNFTEMMLEHDLPTWFAVHASSDYNWTWQNIFIDLANGRFFQHQNTWFDDNSITGEYLTPEDAKQRGKALIGKLVAIAAVLPTGSPVIRSLELDGFSVNRNKAVLVPLEGAISADEESDLLTSQVRRVSLPNTMAILKHIEDARDSYAQGKNHPSLNESRNIIQALVDSISEETDKSGAHVVKLPGGTANRFDYLTNVGFLTSGEKAALGSAWGTLSAGSHPGVPERDQARIGLILALELAQLFLLKYENWKRNGHRAFS